MRWFHLAFKIETLLAVIHGHGEPAIIRSIESCVTPLSGPANDPRRPDKLDTIGCCEQSGYQQEQHDLEKPESPYRLALHPFRGHQAVDKGLESAALLSLPFPFMHQHSKSWRPANVYLALVIPV